MAYARMLLLNREVLEQRFPLEVIYCFELIVRRTILQQGLACKGLEGYYYCIIIFSQSRAMNVYLVPL